MELSFGPYLKSVQGIVFKLSVCIRAVKISCRVLYRCNIMYYCGYLFVRQSILRAIVFKLCVCIRAVKISCRVLYRCNIVYYCGYLFERQLKHLHPKKIKLGARHPLTTKRVHLKFLLAQLYHLLAATTKSRLFLLLFACSYYG